MKLSLSHIIILASILLFGVLSFTRCAKVVAPSGGLKDTIPPHLVTSEPENYSTGFDAEEIEITFNEFIQLKELDKQFISSPPFKEDPEIKERGEEIKVILNDTLKDSTTYTLNFGNAIVDFREGNPMRNFRYVFSTGTFIDSMFVSGQVYDAQNSTPLENVVVMLYDSFRDSLPMQEMPVYVARTDKKGRFVLPNLRKQPYKIFALNDLNQNYLYDSPKEDIAFSDSTVHFTEKQFTRMDTLYKDTIQLENRDSLVIDTIIEEKYRELAAKEYRLRMFNEDKGEQYLKSYSRPKPQKITFTFNRPVKDSISLSLIDSIEQKDYLLPEKNMEDTLKYWILDSSIYNRQYLNFEISYVTKDSLGQDYRTRDTAELSYSFEQELSDTAKVRSNLSSSGKFDLNQQIQVSYPLPIESIDTSGVCLWEIPDTVLIEEKVSLKRDSASLYDFSLTNNLKQDTRYKFRILPNTIQSIYSYYHDTLDVEFRTQKEDHYGQLTMDMDTIGKPFIFQLLKEKDKVYKEKWYPASYNKKVNLEYLDPAKYTIRLILDVNANKEWDPGDYLKHIQPEKVAFYPDRIEIRSNWELELKWDPDFNSFVKPKKEK
jgi:hypothetical protein